jgi:hypothetical protein
MDTLLTNNLIYYFDNNTDKKVHKLPIILKKFNFFQILKKQKRRHIMASEASKKNQIFRGKQSKSA